MFELGMEVIWLRTSLADTTVQEIASGTITKLGKSYGEVCAWVDNNHKAEDALNTAFAWPKMPSTELMLNTQLLMAARHKAESKELFTAVLQKRNELVREYLQRTGK